MLAVKATRSKAPYRVEVHNRIKMHTVYRMSSYRIQYSLAPFTVYGPKKQVNFEKYRLNTGTTIITP
jgi:hypothetical protein